MQKEYDLFPVNNGQEKITSAEWTQYIDHHSWEVEKELRACLYGLGYPRQPSSRNNFTERLYENCVTETKLNPLNYAYILRRIIKKSVSSFAFLSF